MTQVLFFGIGAAVGFVLAITVTIFVDKFLRPLFCPVIAERLRRQRLKEELDPDNVWCCAPTQAVFEDDALLHDLHEPDQVDADFVNSGVIEDISIVVAIDMTRSNLFKGRKCFGGRSLHTVDPKASVDPISLTHQGGVLNPYEQAIVSAQHFLQTDENFPLYYFGSEESASAGGFIHVKDCQDTYDLWQTYHETVDTQELSGPGRLTPILERTIQRTHQLNRFHVLFVLTDGDVEDEFEFGDALAQASRETPLAVVIVGVGDGPFHQASRFDDFDHEDKLFDNLNFIHFSDIAQNMSDLSAKELFFCLAFNEVPRQYTKCKEILNYRAPNRRMGTFLEPISMSDFEFYKHMMMNRTVDNMNPSIPTDTAVKRTKREKDKEARLKRIESYQKREETRQKKLKEEREKRKRDYARGKKKPIKSKVDSGRIKAKRKPAVPKFSKKKKADLPKSSSMAHDFEKRPGGYDDGYGSEEAYHPYLHKDRDEDKKKREPLKAKKKSSLKKTSSKRK